jgi:hypothetical protein
MNERVEPKMTNFCVAYMDVAGGVPMRGVSIGLRRWLAVIVGFIGVLLIAQPISRLL